MLKATISDFENYSVILQNINEGFVWLDKENNHFSNEEPTGTNNKVYLPDIIEAVDGGFYSNN